MFDEWTWIFVKNWEEKVFITDDEQIKINNDYKISFSEWKIVLTKWEEADKKIMWNKIEIINREFEKTISSFTTWYSQSEIDTWKTKVEEAKKVQAGEVSDLLNGLIIEWENVENLAQNILIKASEYSKIYLQAEKRKREEIKALENNII